MNDDVSHINVFDEITEAKRLLCNYLNKFLPVATATEFNKIHEKWASSKENNVVISTGHSIKMDEDMAYMFYMVKPNE